MSGLSKLSRFAKTHTIAPIFLSVFLLCSIFVRGFLSPSNMVNILNQNTAKCVLAAGMTFLILCGYFDLSVGTLMGLTSCLTIGLMPKLGLFPTLLLVLAIGLAAGFLNGFLVAKVGINAFIVTLVTMTIFRALCFIYTETSIGGTNETFYLFSRVRLLGIPSLVWLALALLLLGFFILRFTRHGRNTYAVGGNAQAAKNMGVNVSGTIICNFMICSLCASLAGIMYASKLNSALPTLGWPDAHMIAIASVVLGGTKLSGGYGSMLYTAFGVLALGMVDNVMNLLGLSSYYNTLVSGLILIGVLYLDKIIRRE